MELSSAKHNTVIAFEHGGLFIRAFGAELDIELAPKRAPNEPPCWAERVGDFDHQGRLGVFTWYTSSSFPREKTPSARR